MARRDLYEVLGVARDADAAALKKAYRRIALECHPDRNPDPAASDRFKEATEAYSVLGTPESRARYDAYGFAGVDGRAGGFDPEAFTDFADLFGMFSSVFGVDLGSAGRARRTGPLRGDDLLVEMALEFEEAALGCEKELRVPRAAACDACSGSGATPGTGRQPCPDCGGRGQLTFRQGFLAMSRTCGRCRGEGRVLESPCSTCSGQGLVESERRIRVKVPAGISEGQRIRLAGEGNSGLRGGPAGDLYAQVSVAEHRLFQRDGADLHLVMPVSFPQAALGAEIEVPTLEGRASVKVSPGSETGDVIELAGQGVARLGKGGRGRLFVHLRVRTPRRLGSKQAALLRAYAEAVEERYEPGDEKGVLEKVRDFFS